MKHYLAVLALPVLLIGCAGKTGGDPVIPDASTISAQFIDAPVKGITMQKESGAASTGDNGAFTCVEGEEVTYSIANTLELGSAPCSSKVFVQDIAESEEKAQKITAVLMSFAPISGGVMDLSATNLSDDLSTLSAINTSLNDSSVTVSSFITNNVTPLATVVAARPANNNVVISVPDVATVNAHIASSMATYYSAGTLAEAAHNTLFGSANNGKAKIVLTKVAAQSSSSGCYDKIRGYVSGEKKSDSGLYYVKTLSYVNDNLVFGCYSGTKDSCEIIPSRLNSQMLIKDNKFSSVVTSGARTSTLRAEFNNNGLIGVLKEVEASKTCVYSLSSAEAYTDASADKIIVSAVSGSATGGQEYSTITHTFPYRIVNGSAGQSILCDVLASSVKFTSGSCSCTNSSAISSGVVGGSCEVTGEAGAYSASSSSGRIDVKISSVNALADVKAKFSFAITAGSSSTPEAAVVAASGNPTRLIVGASAVAFNFNYSNIATVPSCDIVNAVELSTANCSCSQTTGSNGTCSVNVSTSSVASGSFTIRVKNGATVLASAAVSGLVKPVVIADEDNPTSLYVDASPVDFVFNYSNISSAPTCSVTNAEEVTAATCSCTSPTSGAGTCTVGISSDSEDDGSFRLNVSHGGSIVAYTTVSDLTKLPAPVLVAASGNPSSLVFGGSAELFTFEYSNIENNPSCAVTDSVGVQEESSSCLCTASGGNDGAGTCQVAISATGPSQVGEFTISVSGLSGILASAEVEGITIEFPPVVVAHGDNPTELVVDAAPVDFVFNYSYISTEPTCEIVNDVEVIAGSCLCTESGDDDGLGTCTVDISTDSMTEGSFRINVLAGSETLAFATVTGITKLAAPAPELVADSGNPISLEVDDPAVAFNFIYNNIETEPSCEIPSSSNVNVDGACSCTESGNSDGSGTCTVNISTDNFLVGSFTINAIDGSSNVLASLDVEGITKTPLPAVVASSAQPHPSSLEIGAAPVEFVFDYSNIGSEPTCDVTSATEVETDNCSCAEDSFSSNVGTCTVEVSTLTSAQGSFTLRVLNGSEVLTTMAVTGINKGFPTAAISLVGSAGSLQVGAPARTFEFNYEGLALSPGTCTITNATDVTEVTSSCQCEASTSGAEGTGTCSVAFTTVNEDAGSFTITLWDADSTPVDVATTNVTGIAKIAAATLAADSGNPTDLVVGVSQVFTFDYTNIPGGATCDIASGADNVSGSNCECVESSGGNGSCTIDITATAIGAGGFTIEVSSDSTENPLTEEVTGLSITTQIAFDTLTDVIPATVIQGQAANFVIGYVDLDIASVGTPTCAVVADPTNGDGTPSSCTCTQADTEGKGTCTAVINVNSATASQQLGAFVIRVQSVSPDSAIDKSIDTRDIEAAP